MPQVRIQEAPFDAGEEFAALTRGRRDVGGVAAFVGLVRDLNEGDAVSGMRLEHYPGMTESALQEICTEATRRWSVLGIRVVHRVGTLVPGDPIVWVGVASAHRGEAFEACAFVMDYLKTRAPFWKKERTPSGERWVEARASDDEAASRWNPTPGPGS